MTQGDVGKLLPSRGRLSGSDASGLVLLAHGRYLSRPEKDEIVSSLGPEARKIACVLVGSRTEKSAAPRRAKDAARGLQKWLESL